MIFSSVQHDTTKNVREYFKAGKWLSMVSPGDGYLVPCSSEGWAALSTWEPVRNALCSTLDLLIRVAFWQDCRVNLNQWSLRSPDLSTQVVVLWSFWYFYSEKKNKIRQPRFSRRSIFATGNSRKLTIFIIRSFSMAKTGGVSSMLMKSHPIVLQVEGDQHS